MSMKPIDTAFVSDQSCVDWPERCCIAESRGSEYVTAIYASFPPFVLVIDGKIMRGLDSVVYPFSKNGHAVRSDRKRQKRSSISPEARFSRPLRSRTRIRVGTGKTIRPSW